MAFLLHDARGLERRSREIATPERRRASRRLWRVDLLQAAAVATVAIAVALFLADGGAAGITDLAGAVTASGIVAGLIATDLVLVMLVLAARVPFIERAVGQDAAMALHRRLGKPVLFLLLAHAVLLVAGYALADGSGLVDEVVSLWNTPDVPLAVLGLGLFLAVVGTSLVAVRRRFRYEVWHGIHLLVYLAVLAALPHQFSLGGLFAEGTWQRWYWLLLTIAAFAAIVVYRFGMPLYRTLRHRLVVEAVEPVGGPADGVVSIRLRGVDLERLGAVGRAVPRVAVPRPRTVVAGAPLLALGGPARRRAAHHGAGARARVGRPRRASAPARASRSRARTASSARRPAAGAASCSSRPASASRRCARSSSRRASGRARPPCCCARPRVDEGWLLDEVRELCHARGATLITIPGRRGVGWLSAEAERQGLSLVRVRSGRRRLRRVRVRPAGLVGGGRRRGACGGTASRADPSREVRLVRARAFVIASAASAAALLAGWQLGSAVTGPGATVASSGGSSTATSGTDASSSTSSGSAASGGTTERPIGDDRLDRHGARPRTPRRRRGADGTYAGATVSTRFGDVQVQVTISGGAISDVTALQLTDHDGRSVSISNRAAPILRDEVLQAQTASVSFVGGATYTSAAYLQSLQAALDAAGF